ncbi:dihydrofolate reductase [Panacibacter sp. DH6]|uniref:Dihydrofolate reductase n=1 Tax=Panacibacter microcysteis TaxID=2793269 RepID=A0A931E7G6_9BACT|nr:dihydrofolate reductase [Panacibacter microcysteis]MBG9376493.1 dihydrofolate reductase [Panacibacter microcysteis]
MILTHVVAAAANNAIGKDNQLLWHLPNDLKFFKNITWAMPVAMGRKSFESLGNKPLNGRFNIIITRNKAFTAKDSVVVHNFDDAIFIAQQNDYKELMILGGGEIYKQSINIVDKIYITRVHATFEDADAFYPVIDESKFRLVSNQDFFADEKHAYDYSFQLWEKQ